MLSEAKPDRDRWMSLGDACRLLGVNDTPLRGWADDRRIRTFRTLGGHRRFARDDIEAVLESSTAPVAGRSADDLGQRALKRIRRRLQHEAPNWHDAIDEQGRTHLRLLGRRLVSLATEHTTTRRRRAEVLEEVRFLGAEYGQEMRRNGLSQSRALEAFLFFRNSLLDAHAPASSIGAPEDRAFQKAVMALSDEVLLAMTRSFEAARA